MRIDIMRQLTITAVIAILSLFSTTVALGAASTTAASASTTGTWTYIPEASLGPQQMGSITCLSASNCWAVGQIIAHWGGASWRTVATAPEGGVIAAVSCLSATNCWGVGFVALGRSASTLVEHWNGGSWVRVPSPSPSPTNSAALLAVSCPSANDCWAVGTGGFGTVNTPLIEHWSGSAWTVVASPPPVTYFNAVVCKGAAACWAVGTGGIDRLSGTRWVHEAVPSANYGAMSCESVSDCLAVADTPQTVLNWNGSAWSKVSVPPLPQKPPGVATCLPTQTHPCPPPTQQVSVNYVQFIGAVSCHRTLGCVLFAQLANGELWSERWNGSTMTGFAMAPVPGLPARFVTIHGIACPTSRECLAIGVGTAGAHGAPHVIFEKFRA